MVPLENTHLTLGATLQMLEQQQPPQSCDLDSPIRAIILKSLLQELSSASVGCAAEGDPPATRSLGVYDDSLTQGRRAGG